MSSLKPGDRYFPRRDQRIAYLVEECGETLAAAGKALRWGLDSSNPELPEGERETNREWLLRELADLRQAIDLLEPILLEDRLPGEGGDDV